MLTSLQELISVSENAKMFILVLKYIKFKSNYFIENYIQLCRNFFESSQNDIRIVYKSVIEITKIVLSKRSL